MLIHDFSDSTLRKVKTDKADSMKIVSYALTFWQDLWEYSTEDETRQMLKAQSRLYERIQSAGTTLRNGLISLLDQIFPSANQLLDNTPCSNGYIKWVDFVRRFWHKDCVTGVSLSTFSATYQKCCTSKRYPYTQAGAEKIYRAARACVATFPKNDSTKLLIAQPVNSLNAFYDAPHIMCTETLRLASLLPEFESVIPMQGAGKTVGL